MNPNLSIIENIVSSAIITLIVAGAAYAAGHYLAPFAESAFLYYAVFRLAMAV